MLHIIGWMFFGLIAGFIASKIVDAQGQGCILNIVLGIVGAVVGGAMFQFLGAPGAHGFLWSLFTAVVGAIVVLILWQAVTGKRSLR